jgi:Tfp pilus assembly protein PilN
MTVEPSIVYAVVGGLVVAIIGLWAVVLADHRNCQRNLKEQSHTIALLTEHTIAQQADIRSLVDDRQKRGLPDVALQSERTAFYRQKIDPGEDGV